MSDNLRNIIIILSLVYVLSGALVCSGIAYGGGINCIKLLISWFFFASGIILVLAKVSQKNITFFNFIRKRKGVSS